MKKTPKQLSFVLYLSFIYTAMYEIFSRFSGIGIFFIVFIILILGFRVVPPNQANIVVRLGKPVRVRRQGWHLIIPILEGTIRQSLYDKNLAVSVDGLTLDNVKTAVGINVVYRVKQDEQSILDSKFAIDDPVRIVQATVEEQLRAKIFTFEHEEIF